MYMKIGIILSRCHWFGSSRYILETSQYFAKRGHEIHIFANTWDKLKNKRIHFHKIPTFFRSNLLIREAILTFFATIIQKFHKFDVTLAQPTRYFTPDVGEVQFVYKAWIDNKRKNKIKDSLPIRISDAWLSWMEKRNVKRCKAVITLSNSEKNALAKNYKISPEKIFVSYNGVNLNEFDPRNRKLYFKDIRKKHNIPFDAKLILFVGNPFQRKGLEYIIRALPKIKDKNSMLLVCGLDRPKNIASYKELSKKLNIDNRIIWNIKLTPEIKKYFAASDIFVFPTLYEPFGLVIIEAMASGLPTITSKLAGAAELIEDGKDGLLLKNPKNCEEIAEKIIFLFDNKNLMKRIKRNARKKSTVCSWDKIATVILNVLEKAAPKVQVKYR